MGQDEELMNWEEYQKIGDDYYNKGNLKEANIYWKRANELRDDVIGKQMDIMNINQQIRKALEGNRNV